MKFCGECGAKLPEPDAPCPACAPPPKAEDDPNREGDIEIYYWCGQKRYRCPLKWESGAKCAYDTYDIDALREHISVPHTANGKPKESGRTVVSPIYDHNGKQIVRQEFKDREVPAELRTLKFKQ